VSLNLRRHGRASFNHPRVTQSATARDVQDGKPLPRHYIAEPKRVTNVTER
jgi:hypothetical protein